MLKRYFGNFILGTLLLYIVFLTVKPLLRSGYYPMHDDQQVIRLFEMDKCVRDLQIPCRWVPDMGYGYGYPQFNYYAPLPYYFMEIFHLTGLSLLDSIKFYLVLMTLLSVWSMYRLSAKFWESEFGGILSALFYALLPYRAVNLYVRGALGEYTAQAITPLILLYSLLLIKEKKKTGILYFSLSLAVLWLSHTISAMTFLPFLGIWLAFYLFYGRRNEAVSITKKIIFALFGSLVLSAFFLLPAFFEKGLVHTETLTANYFDFRAHFLGFRQILFSNSWGYGSSLPGSDDRIMLGIGLWFWIAGLVSMILAVIIKKKRLEILLINLLGWMALFFTHSKSEILWNSFPLMKYIQFPWRFNLFAGIFFCLAAGYTGSVVVGRNVKAVLTVVFMILLLLFYGRSFRPDKWLDITDNDKLSGREWTLAQTVSINDYLPVHSNLSPANQAQGIPKTLEGNVNYINIEQGTYWQRWNVVADGDALVQAQIFYFPDWKVYVDKVDQPYSYKDYDGLITFNLSKGLHEVILKLMDTPVRIFGNLITLLGLPVFLWLYTKIKYEK